MKSNRSINVLLALILGASVATFALAHEAHNQKKAEAAGSFIKAKAAGVSAEWLAKARADYPTDACVVSDDNLEKNDMGPPQDWVYRKEGKPDRLVRLCCDHCVDDFNEKSERFLKELDEAAAKAEAQSAK